MSGKGFEAIRSTHRALIAAHPEIHTLPARDQLRVLRDFVSNLEERKDANPTE